MTTIRAPVPKVWECRWSRPSYRPGIPDELQPATPWVCVRSGERRLVFDEECERCPEWQAVPPRTH